MDIIARNCIAIESLTLKGKWNFPSVANFKENLKYLKIEEANPSISDWHFLFALPWKLLHLELQQCQRFPKDILSSIGMFNAHN